MKKFLEEFKKFALRGNVIDMAVGVIIGAAFGKIVTSLVGDVFMPLISRLVSAPNIQELFLSLDGITYASLAAAQEAGAATLNYGMFLQTVIDFVLMAFCVFLFVKGVSKLRKKQPEAPKPRLCPYCRQAIDDKATRCPHCTSQLDTKAA